MDPAYGLRAPETVSSIVEAILFGLYLASFTHCVRWLLFEDEGWRVRKKINRTLMATTLFVFFLSMASFSTKAAVGLFHGVIALTRGIQPAFSWVVVLLNDSNAIYSSILIVIDSVLIHRCWIVFSKNWFIICFPLALWCSCLICAIIRFYCSISTLLNPMTMIGSTNGIIYRICRTQPAQLLTFFVCNIVVSIYTTAALVFKILSVAKNNVGTNRLYRTSRILTESGILYTLSSAFFLACCIEYFIPTSSLPFNQFLLSNLLNAIAIPVSTYMPGIAFNLITIRVSEQRARGQDTWVDSMDTSSALLSSEVLDNPDTLIQQEVESTNLDREVHEGVDEGVNLEKL